MSARPAPISVNPALLQHAQERRKSWENRDEEQQNEELLRLSNQILELTKAIHATSAARAPAGPPESDAG